MPWKNQAITAVNASAAGNASRVGPKIWAAEWQDYSMTVPKVSEVQEILKPSLFGTSGTGGTSGTDGTSGTNGTGGTGGRGCQQMRHETRAAKGMTRADAGAKARKKSLEKNLGGGRLGRQASEDACPPHSARKISRPVVTVRAGNAVTVTPVTVARLVLPLPVLPGGFCARAYPYHG